MNKQTLKYNLHEIAKETIRFAKELTWNKYSDNVYFKIKPNVLDDNDHLDNDERINLGQRKAELDKILTIDQVVDRLCFADRVPVWTNISIERTTKKWTIIELMTSRRFSEDNYMHKDSGFPPFHIAIATPIYRNEKEKFNINWRHDKFRTKFYTWIWKLKTSN
jgi:hypothetical protein